MEDKKVILKVQGVQKSFDGKAVHTGIDLDVYEGEILTLMGGSGTGKSVLLRSMIGLDKPDEGQILYGEHNIVDLNEEQLVDIRKEIAYVFQNGALFDSLSVHDNLAYPLREHTKMTEKEISAKVADTLSKIGLEGSEKLLPSDLSGGMQKRVGVARSIIMDPKVILYDEPTSGLDPFNTRQILRIVRQLQGHGATSVLVTHDMSSLFQVTDRIAFLKDGVIKTIGTADEIKRTRDPVIRGFIQGERT